MLVLNYRGESSNFTELSSIFNFIRIKVKVIIESTIEVWTTKAYETRTLREQVEIVD